MSGWTTIESDPGLFTELIAGFGAKGVQVEEMYDVTDASCLAPYEPVLGLIFLFKWVKSVAQKPVETVDAPDVFFAKQVISNACASQAVLSVLLNRKEVDLGPVLKEFKEFTADFSPEMRGLSIGNSETIRRVHNSFARPEPFVLEERRATDKDDVYHFISYVPVNGVLYELDGLSGGPIAHGPVGDEWISRALEVIRERIALYGARELHFSLMAVVTDPRPRLRARLLRTVSERAEAATAAEAEGRPVPPLPARVQAALEAVLADAESAGDAMDTASAAVTAADLPRLDATLSELAAALDNEETKHQNWRVDNLRRKHNYVPFVVHLLRILAEKNELMPLLERAKGSV